MPFVKVEVTPEESRALLLQDEELQRVYEEAGGGRITTAARQPPDCWYVNEEEDASICLLGLGTGPWCDPRHLYILRINKNYIVFQLISNKNKIVRFIHNSPLLDNELYRVKYLILAGLNSVGYWGLGITDIFADAVLDPVFEFAQELRC